MNRPIATDWYTRTFDALYPIVYGHRSVEAACPEAQFAADQVKLRAEDAVLDLCCGNGRHMIHLLRTSPRLIGLDYSADLLRIAKEQIGVPSPARLVRADMRRIPFVSAFDVVFNFFTSFGYFFSAEDNRSVVRGVADALKPQGRFFIDYVNRAYVAQNLVSESSRREGAYEIHERRWIGSAPERVNKKTCVRQGAQLVAETEESVRLYTLEEFQDLLAAGGLVLDRVFGDFGGAPFDERHPRMIVVGHRA